VGTVGYRLHTSIDLPYSMGCLHDRITQLERRIIHKGPFGKFVVGSNVGSLGNRVIKEQNLFQVLADYETRITDVERRIFTVGVMNRLTPGSAFPLEILYFTGEDGVLSDVAVGLKGYYVGNMPTTIHAVRDDALVITTSGNLSIFTRYHQPYGYSGFGGANADPNNNIYFKGNSEIGHIIAKMNSGGSFEWFKYYDFGGYTERIVATDTNAYFNTTTTIQIGNDYFAKLAVGKVSSSGSFDWLKIIFVDHPTPIDRGYYGYGISLTSGESIWLVGDLQKANQEGPGCGITLLNSGGTVVSYWMIPNGIYGAVATNLLIGSNYDCVAVGTHIGYSDILGDLPDGNYILVSKYSTSNHIWTQAITVSGALSTPLSICFDDLDNIYFCGTIDSYGYYAKLDSSGNLLWQKYIDLTGIQSYFKVNLTGIRWKDDKIFMSGTLTQNPPDPQDYHRYPLILQLNDDGTIPGCSAITIASYPIQSWTPIFDETIVEETYSDYTPPEMTDFAYTASNLTVTPHKVC
jgi:hypothetical protein